MPRTDSNACRGCLREMLWATVISTGKAIPLDPEPVENGNLVLAELAPGAALRVAYVSDVTELNPLAPRYQSHFVSCPNAGDFRKKKR